jgi:Family of unknown function (DUF6399)
LRHHSLHRLGKRKLAALTVLHNYWLKRADGTTAAERFFGSKPADLFEWLLERMELPARPARRRNKAAYSLPQPGETMIKAGKIIASLQARTHRPGFRRRPASSPEHRPDRLLLHVRVQVPVPPPLLVGLVADDVVDDSLVHSFAGQGRDEGVTKNVKALQHGPL